MKPSLAALLLVTTFLVAATPQAVLGDDDQQLVLLVNSLAQIDDAGVQAALLQGMLSGLAGRRDVPPPKGWSKLAVKLNKSEDATVRELTSQLSQIFGDKAAMKLALQIVRDSNADPATRRRNLHALLNQKSAAASSALESLLDDPTLRLDAIRGYAAIENPKAAALLLSRYAKWPSELKKAAIETMATRKVYAADLLSAIKTKQIPREDIPAHVARSMQFLLGAEFTDAFGDVRRLAQDRTKQILKYKQLLTTEALAKADASQGRKIFKKTCASCHLLYGAGGKIGPDLTGSNRANLDYILLNSVDPSYDVPEGYRMVVIQTADGRVVNGVIAEEDNRRVVLKTVEQPKVIVLKSDIEDRQVSPKSMMPEGQLDEMKPQEVINLIKYLQTIEQVEEAP